MSGPVEITDPQAEHAAEVLTPGALEFLGGLHRSFDGRLRQLLADCTAGRPIKSLSYGILEK